MKDTITFEDKRFEEYILGLLNKSEGPIDIKDVKSIKEITYEDTLRSQNDFDNLRYFTGLEELDISTVTSVDVLSGLEQLSYLFLELPSATTDVFDLELLKNMKNLETLGISGGMLSGMELINSQSLRNNKSLKSIQFHEFGHVDLSFLEELTQLEHFMCGWPDGVTNVEAISKLTNIKELELDVVKIESIDFLADFSDDLYLILCGCRISKPFDKNKLIRFKKREIDDIYVAGDYIGQL